MVIIVQSFFLSFFLLFIPEKIAFRWRPTQIIHQLPKYFSCFVRNDMDSGFVCRLSDQPSYQCHDYRVRFRCPSNFCQQGTSYSYNTFYSTCVMQCNFSVFSQLRGTASGLRSQTVFCSTSSVLDRMVWPRRSLWDRRLGAFSKPADWKPRRDLWWSSAHWCCHQKRRHTSL